METTMELQFTVKNNGLDIQIGIPIENKNDLLRKMGFFVHGNLTLLFKEFDFTNSPDFKVSNDLEVRFEGLQVLTDLTQDHTISIDVKDDIKTIYYDFEECEASIDPEAAIQL